ncbi:hypothetical protein HPB48_009838 [Haemaphysalis longicornis]|uniref:Uncharacterized protein n=1 Tax=Haemaphysalis longicornis TaxID=44386 RepID=A0A9J6GV22_HAELO|nr:hypothetical protein HPB48_009838 [Haemaphysalis longicornis]
MKDIEISGRKHEVGAYATVPEGSTNGVIHNTAFSHLRETILAKLITHRNPTVILVRRIGNTPFIIVSFEGDRVPRQGHYTPSILDSPLYRKQFNFFTTSAEVAHSRDVCLMPNVQMCADCGLKNPKKEHAETCKPKCSCAMDLIPPDPTVAEIDTRLLTLFPSEDGQTNNQRENDRVRSGRASLQAVSPN